VSDAFNAAATAATSTTDVLHRLKLDEAGGSQAIEVWQAEKQQQCRLLRDIFGDPFRVIGLDPRWLQWNGRLVAKIAQAVYADRAFDRLSILADALEEAGCDNQDILAHCRSGGGHVRGCWVVDLLLEKS
jgi:hypothetical protein